MCSISEDAFYYQEIEFDCTNLPSNTKLMISLTMFIFRVIEQENSNFTLLFHQELIVQNKKIIITSTFNLFVEACWFGKFWNALSYILHKADLKLAFQHLRIFKHSTKANISFRLRAI